MVITAATVGLLLTRHWTPASGRLQPGQRPCPRLDVVRRNPAPGQRRLAGRIDGIAGEDVLLAESFDHLAGIPAREVTLEGSPDAHRLPRVMLGGRFNKFEAERQRLEPKLRRLGCFHCAGLGFYALAGMAGVMVRGIGAPIRTNRGQDGSYSEWWRTRITLRGFVAAWSARPASLRQSAQLRVVG